MSSTSLAQSTATSVDFYGARSVSIQEITDVIGLEEGKPLQLNSEEIKRRVLSLPQIVDADVVMIRYPGNSALFVGVQEKGAPLPKLLETPDGEIKLDDDLLNRYETIMELLLPAIQARQSGEDRSAGHAVSEYPPMQEKQEQLPKIADEQFETLAKVLHESSDADSRAAAAYILARATDKKAAAKELMLACNDASALVRNNSVRALGVMASYDQSNDEIDLEIPYEPFLQLLKSLRWTDRNKGVAMVDAMSESRAPELLSVLKKDYLLEIAEMARWKSSGHAFFAIRALARIAGMDEAEILKRSKASESHQDRLDWVDELLGTIK